jgi:hypothetical protein
MENLFSSMGSLEFLHREATADKGLSGAHTQTYKE